MLQILGDSFGNVIHLGERDCSLQRKNQKVLEETPCEVLSESTRAKICDSAVRAAKAAGYENAGTIEFLYDEDSDKYYFMEMNTRVQVEHPITEMVTGVDIVKEQIRIAAGEKLLYTQDDIKISGHEIVQDKCRESVKEFCTMSGYDRLSFNAVRRSWTQGRQCDISGL